MSLKAILLILISMQAILALIVVIIGLIKGRITGKCDKNLIIMGLQNMALAIGFYCLSTLV